MILNTRVKVVKVDKKHLISQELKELWPNYTPEGSIEYQMSMFFLGLQGQLIEEYSDSLICENIDKDPAYNREEKRLLLAYRVCSLLAKLQANKIDEMRQKAFTLANLIDPHDHF